MDEQELRRQLVKLAAGRGELGVEWDGEENAHRVFGVAQGHKYTIAHIPLGELPEVGPTIVPGIQASTCWLNGDDINEKLDRMYDDRPGGKNKIARMKSETKDMAADLYSDLQWAGGHRISMMPSKPNGSGVVINDRRRLVNV